MLPSTEQRDSARQQNCHPHIAAHASLASVALSFKLFIIYQSTVVSESHGIASASNVAGRHISDGIVERWSLHAHLTDVSALAVMFLSIFHRISCHLF